MTLSEDLLAEAREFRLNVSAIAEGALAEAVRVKRTEDLRIASHET